MELKFYFCRHCGNIIVYMKSSGVKVICCGEEMQPLLPKTQDLGQEKHVPVITKIGNKVTVKVGSIEHPMVAEHYIQWIILQTKKGYQKIDLQPNQKPEATFYIDADDEVETAYEYCSVHGLWSA